MATVGSEDVDGVPRDGGAPRVLVVCHANVTRSVVAAELLGQRCPGMDLRSVGTHALDGQPVSPRTKDAVRRVLGEELGLAWHSARQLTDDDVEWADVIVTMEASQTRLLAKRFPAAIRKTSSLGFLARELPKSGSPLKERLGALPLTAAALDDRDDVPDPAGLGDDAYVAAVRDLLVKCAALADRL